MESSVVADETPLRATVPCARTKVLCFVPHLGGGGAEMHLVRLLNHFDRDEFELVVAVARGGGSYESRLPADVALHACGWRALPSSTLRMLSAIPRLRRVLQREQPDMVIAFVDHAIAAVARALGAGLKGQRCCDASWRQASEPASKAASSRVILAPTPEELAAGSRLTGSQDGCRHISRPVFIAGLQNNLEKTLEHLPRWAGSWLRRDIISAYAHADHVISLSAGAADTLAKLVPEVEGRVSVVHNAGYDREVETLALEEPSLPLPKEPWFLGCGRLTAQKDFSTLLRAFARIRDEIPGELWILGEGELRKKLEQEIAALGLAGRVRLPGFVNNPFAFMSRATTFVLSSRWEGFGNVVTEAMVCGTPVISTDCPHGPREILEDGRWGELLPVGDVAGLAAAMRASVLERQRFFARAEAARKHAARFEASRITKEYEAVIRSVLSAKRKRSS